MKFLLLLALVTMYGATGNLTASGAKPYTGSLACPRSYPLKTKFKIMDIIFTCNDRTAKWVEKKYPNTFDLFSGGSLAQMKKFGRKKLNVEVL